MLVFLVASGVMAQDTRPMWEYKTGGYTEVMWGNTVKAPFFMGALVGNVTGNLVGSVTGGTLYGTTLGLEGLLTLDDSGVKWAARTIVAGDSTFLHMIFDAADTTLKYWDGDSWASVGSGEVGGGASSAEIHDTAQVLRGEIAGKADTSTVYPTNIIDSGYVQILGINATSDTIKNILRYDTREWWTYAFRTAADTTVPGVGVKVGELETGLLSAASVYEIECVWLLKTDNNTTGICVTGTFSSAPTSVHGISWWPLNAGAGGDLVGQDAYTANSDTMKHASTLANTIPARMEFRATVVTNAATYWQPVLAAEATGTGTVTLVAGSYTRYRKIK